MSGFTVDKTMISTLNVHELYIVTG